MKNNGNFLAKLKQKRLHKWWPGLQNECCDAVSAVSKGLVPVPLELLCEAVRPLGRSSQRALL